MSAAAYHAFVDAARTHAQQHLFGPPRRPESPSQGQILVRNDTGEPRDRYSVLGIAGPLIDPSDNLPEFQRILGVRGVTPAVEHIGRFVILLEPLPVGSVGRAGIDGVCPGEVEMAAETDGGADIAPGVVARLRSAQTGAARLLWVQPVEDRTNPEIAWAVVRIGGSGSGAVTLALVDEYVETAPNSNQWHYGGGEVVWGATGWETKSGGLTWSKDGSPHIVNGMEANNQDDSETPQLQSNGIVTGTFDNYRITLQPVRGAPVVPVVQVASGVWAMFQPNPVSVECIEA